MTLNCVVTGAASGMGAASVLQLRSAGWNVVGWDVRKPDSPQAWQQVDITDEDSVASAWSAALEHGPISGLVNAAGIWRTETFADLTLADWRRTFQVNVEGTFLTCSAAVRHMREHSGGSIVNFSSLAAVRPPKIPSAPYAASKGAILAFSRALAAEVGQYRIRVNAVLPGAIQTPMLTDTVSAEQLATYAKQSGLGRLGQPDEVGKLVAFLLSESASLVHGASIEVPGA